MPDGIRIKICCISSLAEAELALSCGADALGLVGDMPSGPGIISDELARKIVAALPARTDTFLLTSHTSADAIADHAIQIGARTVQIVRHIEPREYKRLRQRLPDRQLVQVLHVEGPEVIDLLPLYAPHVDAFLLDSGRPGDATAELGGTGRTHDWDISRRVVELAPRPVFLAGGLTPENVAVAVKRVAPFGVDLCSGVRSRGKLDAAQLKAFINEVRGIH